MKMQVSEDEITFLTGGDDPYDDNVVMKKLFHPNLKLLVVSEGAAGCRYYTKVRLSIFVLFSSPLHTKKKKKKKRLLDVMNFTINSHNPNSFRWLDFVSLSS